MSSCPGAVRHHRHAAADQRGLSFGVLTADTAFDSNAIIADLNKRGAISVDGSKDHLDAHRLADGATRRFANDKCGRKAFIKWFAEGPANRVVFEPTGPYHRAFERALGASFQEVVHSV
ncbi:MAG TPA: hypothetical protein VIZ19_00285 [Roseiarcus sp.]